MSKNRQWRLLSAGWQRLKGSPSLARAPPDGREKGGGGVPAGGGRRGGDGRQAGSSAAEHVALAPLTAVPVSSGCMVILRGYNFGLQEDAPNVLTMEYGMPVPNTDRLEYRATYTRNCNAGAADTRNYEIFPNASNGFVGRPGTRGETLVCMTLPGGLGANLPYQIRVGTQVSNMSSNLKNNVALPF
jgi:hypothetical protein